MGSELSCTPGKCLLSFFFLREFFSRALLSERVEQARNLSFDNGDGDGNEKGEKAVGFKTATLHVYHAFFYISLP